ncbi:MAG: hypothetical protein MUE85_03590 [Microscillaceae bacterium]|jgi:hypothetical protein|nr:hypothetical protein [Microscillaceae bacterium]
MEKQEKLSPEDIEILKQAVSATQTLIVLVGVGLSLMLLLSPYMVEGVNSYIIIGGVIVLVGGIFFLIRMLLGKMQSDVKNGLKLIIEGKIEEKLLGNSASYIIVLYGERHLVKKEDYAILAINDQIRLEIAPLSRTLLAIRKIS